MPIQDKKGLSRREATITHASLQASGLLTASAANCIVVVAVVVVDVTVVAIEVVGVIRIIRVA